MEESVKYYTEAKNYYDYYHPHHHKECFNLDGVWTFGLDFEEVFGSSTLAKYQTDRFLLSANPKIRPAPGIAFINTNKMSDTYLDIYEYCVYENRLALVKVSNGTEYGSISNSDLDKILI